MARPCRGVSICIGTGIFLIAAGAVLRFAVAAGSPHGLNVQVVGVVLILAGALGLLPTKGRTGQAKGNIKQAGAKITDAFRH